MTEDGLPICLAEPPMLYQGYCAKRMRLKWRCPLAAKGPPPVCVRTRTGRLATCLHFAHACSDSAYGRTVYTYPRENYRLPKVTFAAGFATLGIARRPSFVR